MAAFILLSAVGARSAVASSPSYAGHGSEAAGKTDASPATEVSARSPDASLPTGVLAGKPISFTPRVIGGSGGAISSGPAQSFGAVVYAKDVAGPAPAGYPPVPQPRDPPFGADVRVTSNVNAQSHPSVAVSPDGSTIIVAYTNQTSPTNRDVYVAKSTNGGATWTNTPVAASASYNEWDPRIIRFASRLYVFFSHDDPATPYAYRWYESANNGASWTPQQINFGSILRNFVSTDASANGSWMYVIQSATCDSAANCPLVGEKVIATHMYDATGAKSGATGYHVLFDGATYLDLTDPTIAVGDGYTMWFSDIRGDNAVSGCAPGQRDLATLRAPTGQNAPPPPNPWPWVDNYVYALCNRDAFHLDADGLGWNIISTFQFYNPTLDPNRRVVSFFSPDNGTQTSLNAALIAGGLGIDFKDPAIFASNPLVHVTYFGGGDLFYSYSLDAGATWAAGLKVNANTGTVVDALRTTDVTYSNGLRIAWQDNRAGNMDIFYSTLSGSAFYIFDRSPRTGTVNVDGVDEPVPTAHLWQQGSPHDVVAPATENLGPGRQLVFVQWSDGDTNAARTVTVGPSDTILTANYKTQYYLTMSASVGTVTPGNSWQDAGATVQIQWTAGCAQATFNQWIGSGLGSYTGPSNPTTIQMNGPITEVAQATVTAWCYIFHTSPIEGLQLTLNGNPVTTPYTALWADGSRNTAFADSPQAAGPQRQYSFIRWDDGLGVQSRTITAGASTPVNYTAIYRLEDTVQVQPTPADCQYTVDGTLYSSAQSFWFADGGTHTVDSPSPQLKAVDTRYVFGTWSDGGSQRHTITVSGPMTLSLTCYIEYRYQFDTSPPALNLLINGTSLPAPQMNLWWRAGSTNTVEFRPSLITADSRYAFASWSDVSPANPRTFSNIVGPGATVYTVQTVLQYRYQLDTVPTGLALIIDGSSTTMPQTLWWNTGSSHTARFQDVMLPDTQQLFTRWSDGDTSNPRTFPVSGAGTYSAVVTSQYLYSLDASASPSPPSPLTLTVDGASCASPCSKWFVQGSTHAVQFAGSQQGATDTQYQFLRWSDASTANPRTFSAISGPATLTVQTYTEYRLHFDTSPAGLGIGFTVNGTSVSTPGSVWWRSGWSAALQAPAQSTPSTGTRYVFTLWSDGGAQTHTITVTGPNTYTATYKTQYQVAFAGLPTGVTGSCSPAADCWFDSASSATLALSAGTVAVREGEQQVFVKWTGGVAGTSYTASAPTAINAPLTASAEFKTQYLVKVVTDPAGGPVSVTVDGASVTNVASGIWVDKGSTLAATVTQDATIGGQAYKFTNWADGTASVTVSVSPTAPTTLTATYRPAGLLDSPALLGGMIALIVAAILIALLLLRRRKRGPEEEEAPPAAAGAPPPPSEEELPAPAAPAEDERVAKLTEAYQSGRISKEQYQANLRRIRGNA